MACTACGWRGGFLRRGGQGRPGIAAATQPDWWPPGAQAQAGLAARAKPLAELLARRPQDAATLQQAVQATGQPTESLRYLPLVSSKTLDWVALLDERLQVVGWAPVDGF